MRRLTAADNIPAGPTKVDPVAEGGDLLLTMGVVGQDGEAGRRFFPREDPIVASPVLKLSRQIRGNKKKLAERKRLVF